VVPIALANATVAGDIAVPPASRPARCIVISSPLFCCRSLDRRQF
jgi:hypothetical protein